MISYNNVITTLGPQQIVVIPPNTSFSTSLKTRITESRNESVKGQRIISINELSGLKDKQFIDHFFVHFNLGHQHDNLKPDIYVINADEKLKLLIRSIKTELLNDFKILNFLATLKITTLILSLIESIPQQLWSNKRIDTRVNLVKNHIEAQISEKLSNAELASMANMAPNSFLRLFKENTGMALQEYIQRRRIEKASVSLHHSKNSIDVIAATYGFCDRYHFSKIFKKVMKVSPGKYKQKHFMV
jgi:AraC-like DNA-binding protein